MGSIVGKLYDVADLLLQEGYFDVKYRPDPQDPRLIEGERDETRSGERIQRALIYLFNLSFDNAEPERIIITNKHQSNPYKEVLTMSGRDKVAIRYSARTRQFVVGRLYSGKYLPIVKSFIKAQDIEGFVNINIEINEDARKLKELAVVLMGLKPRN